MLEVGNIRHKTELLCGGSAQKTCVGPGIRSRESSDECLMLTPLHARIEMAPKGGKRKAAGDTQGQVKAQKNGPEKLPTIPAADMKLPHMKLLDEWMHFAGEIWTLSCLY